jgi:hypothetical protein
MNNYPISAQQTIPHQTGTHPYTQPPKLSRKDLQLACVRNTIRNYFWHVTSEEGAHYLVEMGTGNTFPLEVENVASSIKKLAADSAGTSVSKGTILDAVDIMRSEPAIPVQLCYGRSVRAYNGSLYLKAANGIVEFRPGQSLGVFTAQTYGIAFIAPEKTLPLPCLNTAFINNDKRQVMKLFEYLPLNIDESLLVITWLIMAWLPDTQKVLLELTGDRNSDKSSAQAVLKRLVDPSRQELIRDIPQTQTATRQLAQCDQVISLDQVDYLNDKVQKALLRLLEGDLITWKQKRAREETHVRVSCPVILNSLSSVVTNSKLADSTLTLEMSSPPETSYVSEDALRAALLCIFGEVQAELKSYSFHIPKAVPQPMHDFCRVGCLVAKSLGMEPQAFLDQLQANQQYRHELELEDNPTAIALQAYMEEIGEHPTELSVRELYTSLQTHKPNWAHASWPASPRGLGAKLREIQPTMLAIGIKVEASGKRGGVCRFRLSTVAPTPETITESP